MTTGTGKHGHKDAQEPWPHREGSEGNRGSQQARGSGEGKGQSERQSSSSQGGNDESLQAREYRDDQGNVHHHTKTYMDQHGKK